MFSKFIATSKYFFNIDLFFKIDEDIIYTMQNILKG